jgi:anti-sigma factor ChrR (cupin superfamily)
MSTLLEMQATDSAAARRITLPYPLFEKIDDVPWKPWVMHGVSYKLLSVNARTGGFTCLLQVAPGTKAPIHHHLGAIELLVLSGDIYYDHSNVGTTGDYMYEPAGDIHQPKSDTGCVIFCVFEGPIAGLADDGSVAGIVDGSSMLRMAREDGVASRVHC